MSNPQRQRIQAAGHVSAKPLVPAEEPGVLCPSGIDRLYQQGSARIRFPGSEPGALQAVLLNTAGGLTGDDNIRWEAATAANAHLNVSTAACEKVYRTHGPAAVQQTQLSVAAHGRLEWLPQETILFNGASLHRTLDVQLHESSEALLCESLIVGRQAMHEHIDRLQVRDRWRIKRGDRLLHAEELHLNLNNHSAAREHGSDVGTVHADLRADSMLHDFSAISTLVLISQRSTEWLDTVAQRVRALGDSNGDGNTAHIRFGASVLPHRIVVRVLASDSFQLRRFLLPCISLLNDGRSVPTVWKV